jgi:hypothetical protein
VLRYSLCGFDLEALQQMLVDVNRRLKRNKAFDLGRVQGRIVAALDGIEVLASYSRCCDSCLQRRVTALGQDGQPVERLQYYHRAVGCQIVSAPVKPLLAVEWLQPGEGEDRAALRLLAKLPELYGSPFFDILLLDSLYVQARVLKLVAGLGWDVVITLKQENRELYQNAAGLFQSRPPDVRFQEQQGGCTREVELWETEGLPFTAECPQPVRVLRSQERVTEPPYRKGERTTGTTSHHWVWFTTLEARAFPAKQVWALKQGFLHACQHGPKMTSPSGQLQAAPNRGLAAVTLILCLAFALSSAFTLLHSKIFRLHHPPLIEVARQLYRSLWQMQPPIRAPTDRSGAA